MSNFRSLRFDTTLQLHNFIVSKLSKRSISLSFSSISFTQKPADFSVSSSQAHHFCSSDELEMIKTPLRRQKASLTDADSFSARNALEVTDFPTKTGSTLTSSKVSLHSSFQSPKSPAKERILSILEGGEAFRHKDSDNKLQMFARLEQELSESQDCITKLKGNNFKACKIIESMIATRKEHFQEISKLKDKLQKREEHINELQLNITSIKNQNADSGVHKTKSLHEKISEMNLTATLNPIADNEESMVEDQSTAQLAEQYKLLTIELEEQVQVLTQTINEKEAQFHQLQYDHEHVLNELRMKDSRVVDFEFELLSLNQESKKEDLLTEKSDEGTEKSAGFWVKEIEEKDKEIERLESPLSTESTEDEMPSRSSIRRSDTRQIILTLHEQVNELEDKLKEKENQLLAAQVAYYEADNKLKQVQVKTKECEKSFEDFLMKIDETEVKLSLVERLKDEAEMKVVQLREMVTSLEEHKLSMEEKMCVKDKEMQNKINQLESEKMQAVDAVNQAEKKSQKAREDVKQVEIELLNLKKEVLNMNNQCRQEIVNKLKEAEDRYVVKIQTIECNTEQQIKKIKEAANQLKVVYDRDYIKRTEVEKRTSEVEMVAKELETLKQIVKLANDKMQAMIDNEEELKKTIERAHKEHQAQVKMLRRELDAAALQYSEAILQKTKIMNEKASVEQQLERFEKAEVELSKQVREVRQAFDDAKQNYQRQTLHTEAQKSSLEVKISELESRNAELCNRLIKIQVGDRLSSSLPASPTKIYDSFTGKMIQVQPDNYKRQNSDSAERQYENSSPDLGIDSDHGHFSSLEVNIDKTSRPLLRTLELTETMNTLLVGDHCQEIACTDQHCCNRVRQISNENIDLRKRLLRTRRALEETGTQLTRANQRKKQVERSICKQIHQTSQVLRKAKAGLDSGSDSYLLKK